MCMRRLVNVAAGMRDVRRHRKIPARGIIGGAAMFGAISRCEVKADSGDRFDELVGDLVRIAHKRPDGIVAYSCHPVSGKALSRVFIELYRDHVAFVEFGQRPDIRALVEARDALLVEPANVDLLESPIGGSVLFFGPR